MRWTVCAAAAKACASLASISFTSLSFLFGAGSPSVPLLTTGVACVERGGLTGRRHIEHLVRLRTPSTAICRSRSQGAFHRSYEEPLGHRRSRSKQYLIRPRAKDRDSDLMRRTRISLKIQTHLFKADNRVLWPSECVPAGILSENRSANLLRIAFQNRRFASRAKVSGKSRRHGCPREFTKPRFKSANERA